MFFFFFKQKTAYEMRISDWSSDVCSSDLAAPGVDADDPPGVGGREAAVETAEIEHVVEAALHRGESFGDAVDHLCPHEIVIAEMRGGAIPPHAAAVAVEEVGKIGRASCRERVGQEG